MKRRFNIIKEAFMTPHQDINKHSSSALLKFIIPSLIGLLLFIIPLPWGGGDINIGVGYMASLIKSSLGPFLPAFMVFTVVLSALLTLLALLIKPAFVTENDFLKKLFIISPLQLFIRVIAAFLGLIIITNYTQMGADMVSNPYTGGVVVNDLFPVLATWFFFSGFFLPLLMEFGLMDFFGTLIRKFMKPLFKVPGRSAIDAIASWVGSGPVGVVITDKQYQDGYYTAKEAAIISVCFSLVSLPFSVFIADFLNITKSFVVFYGTISLASFIAALILPRIYPLNKKSDDYMPGVEVKINEEVPAGVSVFDWSVANGVNRAKQAPGIGGLITAGLKTVADVYFSLMPIVLFLGTIALIISEYTPIFQWIAAPIIPLFTALNIPDASLAASATVVGFADMFLPAVFIKGSTYEMTRFIVGVLSFTQLIYMTETGAIILRTKIPVNFLDLLIVFIERTLITLPIVIIIAKLIY